METIISNQKIATKELLINILANVFPFAEFNEVVLHNYLKTSHKRRQLFCRNNTISLENYNLMNNSEIDHQLRRAKKLSKNSKQTLDFRFIDRCFVTCIIISLVVGIFTLKEPNIFLIVLFLAPLMILFFKCLKIEIYTKRYDIIAKCIDQLSNKQKNTHNANSYTKEYYQSNNTIVHNLILLPISNTTDEYLVRKYQLLSLLKVIYDNTEVKICDNLVKLLNDNSFIFYTNLSFSIKDTTRFLAILDKQCLIRLERGDQKIISTLIVEKFTIRGKPIKINTYYNSLNDTMSLSKAEIRKHTPTTITDIIDNL